MKIIENITLCAAP